MKNAMTIQDTFRSTDRRTTPFSPVKAEKGTEAGVTLSHRDGRDATPVEARDTFRPNALMALVAIRAGAVRREKANPKGAVCVIGAASRGISPLNAVLRNRREKGRVKRASCSGLTSGTPLKPRNPVPIKMRNPRTETAIMVTGSFGQTLQLRRLKTPLNLSHASGLTRV